MTAALTAEFKTAPRFHQLREFEISADMEARALLWQMRTGKSKLVIDTACHLAMTDKIKGVVIFAPNGVHANWIDRELPTHHWEPVDYRARVWNTEIAKHDAPAKMSNAAAARWTEAHSRWWELTEEALQPGPFLSWFAFNSESMTRDDVRALLRRVLSRRKPLLVVFDESDDFRTPGARRTKMGRAFASKCAYRRILTGTCVHNSPLNAYSQFEMLKKEALGYRRYSDFKDVYAEYELKQNFRTGKAFKALTGYKNLDDLQERMAPYVSIVNRRDCIDMPDLVPKVKRVALNPEQTRIYKEVHNQFRLYIQDEEVSIGENTARFIKLQQIVSGFLIDEDGKTHTIPGTNNRLEALAEEVFYTSGKVIIWCNFREDMDRVAQRLAADGHEMLQYHGRTSDKEKKRVRELMAPGQDNKVKGVVGHPKSGGRGLDFSSAGKIIWYSHTFDAIIRAQADERATAVGGKNIERWDIIAPGIDEYTLETAANKISVAEMLTGNAAKMAAILDRIEI